MRAYLFDILQVRLDMFVTSDPPGAKSNSAFRSTRQRRFTVLTSNRNLEYSIGISRRKGKDEFFMSATSSTLFIAGFHDQNLPKSPANRQTVKRRRFRSQNTLSQAHGKNIFVLFKKEGFFRRKSAFRPY